MSVLLSDLSEGVATITLNRPEKRNALNPELVAALTTALVETAQRAQVILLRGAGKSFCAGADLGVVAQLGSQAEIRAHAEETGKLFQTLEDLPVPIIAAVQGHAYGAGCGLVTLCDIVIAAADSQFGYPELGHGILPAIVTPPLVRAVGKRQAFRLLTYKSKIDADEALRVGLISDIAVSSEISAEEIARKLASRRVGLLRKFKALANQCDALSVSDSNLAAIEANIVDRAARIS